MKSSIGETLKKCRLEANISVKEISDLLISKGFKASEKTVYSWEQPTNSGCSSDNVQSLWRYRCFRNFWL